MAEERGDATLRQKTAQRGKEGRRLFLYATFQLMPRNWKHWPALACHALVGGEKTEGHMSMSDFSEIQTDKPLQKAEEEVFVCRTHVTKPPTPQFFPGHSQILVPIPYGPNVFAVALWHLWDLMMMAVIPPLRTPTHQTRNRALGRKRQESKPRTFFKTRIWF